MDVWTALNYSLLIFIIFWIVVRRDIKSFMIRKQNFNCIRCGKCCRLLVELSQEDISRIKTDVDYIKEGKD